MHLNYGSKGSTRISKLTDFPDVQIVDHWDKKARKTTRVICVGDREFKTIAEAVDFTKGITAP